MKRLLQLIVGLGLTGALSAATSTAGGPLSPGSLVAERSGAWLYAGCATAPRVLVVDAARRAVTHTIAVPGPVSGLTLSPDERTLVVTCAAPASTICLVDTSTRALRAQWAGGHHAMAPVVSADGRTLFVCNRFTDDVSVIDLTTGRERGRVKVRREPVAAALTPDGRHLLVANLLHDGRADVTGLNAVVSVIDVAEARVAKELALPDGSGALNDLRISPDGRFAAVTHLIGRYHQVTSQVERGWINTNAVTLIALPSLTVVNTVLLDAPDRGAANPWGLAWSASGRELVIAHSGVHEVSVIDFPGLLDRLTRQTGEAAAEVSRDLTFLATLRRRVALPERDLGPRAVAVAGGQAWVANYFSDSLSAIDLTAPGRPVATVELGPRRELEGVRLGEFHFHNARLCLQGWQSCSSCHPGEARVDALNWDLLNDGLGNPKNSRSLLYASKMSPVMSLGVRDNYQVAVRAGVRHAMFTEQPEPVAEAIDHYLASLRPVPSPRLVRGGLSPAAKRGERLFFDAAVGCAECHPRGDYTDMKRYNVGTHGALDRPEDLFYTPTLIENWRTAPYLHDGSAATMREVLTTRNTAGLHGRTSHLTPRQIDELVEYVMSL